MRQIEAGTASAATRKVGHPLAHGQRPHPYTRREPLCHGRVQPHHLRKVAAKHVQWRVRRVEERRRIAERHAPLVGHPHFDALSDQHGQHVLKQDRAVVVTPVETPAAAVKLIELGRNLS